MERILNYTAGLTEITPRAPQFAGVQGEHRVTGILIRLDEELAAAVETEKTEWDHVECRFDFTDGAGNYIAGEPTDIEQIGSAFYLTRAMTKAGGNAEAVFKITCCNDPSEGKEFYSAPIRLYFTPCASVLCAEEDTVSLMSPMVRQAKTFRDEAYDCARVAVEASEEISGMMSDSEAARAEIAQNTRNAVTASASAEAAQQQTEAYASAAEQSASRAEQSAENAADAASSAQQQTEQAVLSASAAVDSAEKAAASENSAAASAAQAASYEGSAQAAAALAGEKSDMAADSAAEAAVSAEEAAASAQNAVSAHNSSAEAHSEQFAAKADLDYANTAFSNALKGQLTGKAVRADGVSPAEHALEVKVSGIGDPTAVTVSRYGKNLFDMDTMLTDRSVKQSDRQFARAALAGTAALVSVPTVAGQAYTVSVTCIGAETANGNGLGFCVMDGKDTAYNPDKYIAMDLGVTTSDKHVVLTFTAPSDWISLSSIFDCFADLQVELGTSQTDYEPYTEPQSAQPDSEGRVTGLTSASPTVTLITDTPGAVLDVSYNRDINKAIDQLIQVIPADSWESVQKIVRSGLAAKFFSIGDQLISAKSGSQLVWDIIGIDHDTPSDKNFKHSLTLQLHDSLAAMAFDAREAFYYAEDGLAAGTYNFTVGQHSWVASEVGKAYQFTLTQPVPAGGQIVLSAFYTSAFEGTKASTYANSTSADAIETVTVTEGAAGTSLGTMSNAVNGNINSCQRALIGGNNYAQSAVRQYINSNAGAGSVWTPQSNFDRPPAWAADTAGFLNGMDEDFLAVIGEVDKVTALNTVSDGGGSVTASEKFFLLSRSEAYGGNENSINEGVAYPYYSENSDLSAPGMGADTNRIKYYNNAATVWRLRSPDVGGTTYVRSVNAAGSIYTGFASSVHGVVPACCIV